MGSLSVTFIFALVVYLTYYNIALTEAKDNSAPSINDGNVQKIPNMWLKAMPVQRFYKRGYPVASYRKENVPVKMELLDYSENDEFDKRTAGAWDQDMEYGHMRFGRR